MHTLNPEPLRRAVRALVIGCGGSGSAIASGLPYLQAMVIFRFSMGQVCRSL